MTTTLPKGIRPSHRTKCATWTGGACDCRPPYEATVFDRRTGKRKSKTLPTLKKAEKWRAKTQLEIDEGLRVGGRTQSIRKEGTDLIKGMRSGAIRKKEGERYKDSTIRRYELGLEHIYPLIGAQRLGDLTPGIIQIEVIDRLLADGMDSSSVRNAVIPLRVIARRAHRRQQIAVNPTIGLELPALPPRRERITTPEEAVLLLHVLPYPDKALWGTAIYAGLRLGELRALQWKHIDLAERVIKVRRSYDPVARKCIKPKSKAGVRDVPILEPLADILIEHKMNQAHARADDLLFGAFRPGAHTFSDSAARTRAYKIWDRYNLNVIGLHECRHSYASISLAAGVNIEALRVQMGHSRIETTLRLYGHLLPGSINESATLTNLFIQKRVTDSSDEIAAEIKRITEISAETTKNEKVELCA